MIYSAKFYFFFNLRRKAGAIAKFILNPSSQPVNPVNKFLEARLAF